MLSLRSYKNSLILIYNTFVDCRTKFDYPLELVLL